MLLAQVLLLLRFLFAGSGGNNHALEYFNETGYPLAVKLGTITAEGGDVYSYDEDDMVEDPKLAQHLAHFGINIASLEKVIYFCGFLVTYSFTFYCSGNLL